MEVILLGVTIGESSVSLLVEAVADTGADPVEGCVTSTGSGAVKAFRTNAPAQQYSLFPVTVISNFAPLTSVAMHAQQTCRHYPLVDEDDMFGTSADKGSQSFCARWSEQSIHGFGTLLLSDLKFFAAPFIFTFVCPERPDQVHKDPCAFTLDGDCVGALDKGEELRQTRRGREAFH